MKFTYTLLILGTILISHTAVSQSVISMADKEYKSMAYQRAASLYEEAMNGNNLGEGEKLAVRSKLAYCYRQLKDSENAERVLREIISGNGEDLAGPYVENYLYYAEALASNGKYNEAQETYEKYTNLTASDLHGPGFAKLYTNVALLTKNAGSYKVDRLDLNTSDADFSPMYYKEGIVFVSGRTKANGIRRVFNWDQTPFLDLYYLDNLKKLKGKTVASSLGGSKAVASSGMSGRKRKSILGRDSYTALTANDSRTVGFYAGSAYNSNLGYEESPRTESERFNKAINSKYHEGPVSFFKEGNRVIFTRNNYNDGKYGESEEGINKLKLYSAELVKGEWTKIEELPFNSDEFSTGHPALNPDNTVLYFVSDRPGGLGGTDIYVSRLEGAIWSEPINMGPEINTKGNEMFPFVDANGNLYFSSDGRPGLGDLDVFYAPMESYAKAKKSINLGAPINSNKDDFGLITDAERTQGYFSSNRKGVPLDDDIYRFRREGPLYACRDLTVNVYDDDSKTPLANVLVQIEDKSSPDKMRQLQTDSLGNLFICLASENEFIFIASETGYQNNTLGFTTTSFDDERPSLLEIPLKKVGAEKPSSAADLTTSAKGFVLAQNGTRPLSGVKVSIKDDTDGTTQEITTDDNGQYVFRAVPGHNYSIDVNASEYGTFGKRIVDYDPDSPADLSILMFAEGESVRIDNIYYDLNKATIRSDAAHELDKVVEIMGKYPNMKIELGAHTDSRATSRYNRILSDKRAKEARNYLVSRGIESKRISAKGYGESKLVNECGDGRECSEAEHQKNRRTEIRIMNLQ
ncbi:OmpA family protein [Persicitalea jodogahamensis]|uniref:OmpA-like domain-containing protein n=1 Tax=Persicitalea jodogahamensis TaxID=402147 RepID=A0A8J3G9C8_9BACT|nr:OmpA family protein [Persicitalea jodogahamensis]GHB71883.1 hypothetical protein GCM10007390_27280 [Persicitalea jodogahamensis]